MKSWASPTLNLHIYFAWLLKSFSLKLPWIILAIILLTYLYGWLFGAIQTKQNPNQTHYAKLFRDQGIDVNFRIKIDGETVYFSPDFAPVDLDFREQIAWDKSGNILILEVAGKRIFGYDAEKKRQLSDKELLEVEFIPFIEYRYEGKLPKQISKETNSK